MNIQNIIAVALLVVCSLFLVWKFIAKPLVKKTSKKDCGPECKCADL